MRYALLVLALMIAPLPALAVEEVPATPAAKLALFDDVTSNLACLCGCGTTIKTCPHDNCPFAVPIRQKVHGMIDQGLGKQQIYDNLVATVRYDGTRLGRGENVGQAILASPPAKGFNILAYVTPFIVILGVGTLVWMLIQTWAGKRRQTVEGPDAPEKKEAPDENDPYLKKMKDQLEDFDD